MLATTVEAVYENGVFVPLQKPLLHEHERVRLQVESLQAEDQQRRWGSYESLKQTFDEMPQDAGVDDAAWARFEAELKAQDLKDMEKTLHEIASIMRSHPWH